MKNDSNLMMIMMVAIVAVVGVVAIFMNSSPARPTGTEAKSLVGEAAMIIEPPINREPLPIDTSLTCTDSDGGENIYIKGTVTNGNLLKKTDNCPSSQYLFEHFCKDNTVPLKAAFFINTGIKEHNMQYPHYALNDKVVVFTDMTTYINITVSVTQNGSGELILDGKIYNFRMSNPSSATSEIKFYYPIITYKEMKCQYGCSDGACNKNITCTDSDGGKNYKVKGTCISPGATAPDICLPDSQNPSVIRLNEKYCGSNGCTNEIFICPTGSSCVEGACKPQVYANETVKCNFMPSYNTTHICSSNKGNCTGLNYCSVFVWGTLWTNVTWHSDCNGSPITVIDGVNQKIQFNCTL